MQPAFDITPFNPDTPYTAVLTQQEDMVARVLAGGAPHVFLGEHAPTITLGTSADETDVLSPEGFEVVPVGRGGQVTLHTPGQLVAYPILNLRHHQQDLRWYVRTLQEVIVQTLAAFGIQGDITDDIGVWVADKNGQQQKIAAIGIRVRKWVTFHGMALNVSNNLADYSRIVPCGITEKGVTSMAACGCDARVEEVQAVLISHLNQAFG